MGKMDQTLKMFKELTEAHGVPGNEREVRKVMEKYIIPFADSIQYDHLGSLIAEQKGTSEGPRIMVAGHLDEIGFMVTKITEEGFLRIEPLGFWWTQNMMAQKVKVITRQKEVKGIIGFKFPETNREKTVEMKDMFIDIGAESKEQAVEYGVRPGDMVIPDTELTQLENPKLLVAKAWDNRIGCSITIELLKQLKETEHPNTVFGVGTVQEEIGCRGAKTSTEAVAPDVMFAVDVTIANDVPGDKSTSKMGKGPVIFIKDSYHIPHKGLLDFVIETAEEEQIPYQLDAVSGGTDAGAAQYFGRGVPSIAITVPTRYIHSHTGLLNRDDFENAVALIKSCIRKMDSTWLKNLHDNQ
ncbi:M42 family metallopeptidase [Fictibacillus sp. Mic-4]|uniref:M42 family metallopeptidase n=1 Tax=Fictibacillus TaxID=1329200 RepID=UPI00047BC600|nr:M42 family metallopeptidase [Fictibacillus gelatini]